MVIWSGDAVQRGALIWKPPCPRFSSAGHDAIDSIEAELQNLMLRIRYAQVPVISAIHGMALGGGCELAVYRRAAWPHGKAIWAWWEVGVGLVPAPALTYIVRRAAGKCRQQHQQRTRCCPS